MQTSYHIRHLDLSHNEFGEESGVILGPALGKPVHTFTNLPIHLRHANYCCLSSWRSAESEALQTLDLSWNHIRRKGAKAIAVGLMVRLLVYTWSEMLHMYAEQIKSCASLLIHLPLSTLYPYRTISHWRCSIWRTMVLPMKVLLR